MNLYATPAQSLRSHKRGACTCERVQQQVILIHASAFQVLRNRQGHQRRMRVNAQPDVVLETDYMPEETARWMFGPASAGAKSVGGECSLLRRDIIPAQEVGRFSPQSATIRAGRFVEGVDSEVRPSSRIVHSDNRAWQKTWIS